MNHGGRWVCLGMALVMMAATMCSCGGEPVVEGYAGVTKTDSFGDHSIVLLGDSISHGANVKDIPNESYVGLLRKAINDKAGTTAKGTANYGFTTIEGTLQNTYGTYTEMHAAPKTYPATGSAWNQERGADLLGIRGYTAQAKGFYLDFAPQETFRYFCVYYEQGPDYGSFTVGTGDTVLADEKGKTEAVDCVADTASPARTAFYDFSKLVDNKIRVTVADNKKVTITGIGYFNDKNAVVLENYSNSGLMLSGNTSVLGLGDSTIDLATDAETVIMSLGYNDSHISPRVNQKKFTEKINYLIEKANEKGTKIVVNDLCWYFGVSEQRQVQYYKDELKRLADETGGLYVDQQAINGKALLDTIKDGAHPTAKGHKMIADALIAAMELGTEATDAVE